METHLKLPAAQPIYGRQDIVLERCAGKRVLHIGCVDTGLLEQRFKEGGLMHQKLVQVASEVWGVDINQEGIAFLQEHGFDHLYVVDAAAIGDMDVLQGEVFDILVATELVEHLSNPGLFLDSVRKLMQPGKTELLITVPNAFRITTLYGLLRGIEIVHPDHNYWFSYRTITTLLRKHGFDVTEVHAYTFSEYALWDKPPQKSALRHILALPKRLLNRFLFSKTAFWGDGLIVYARSTETR